MAHKFKLTVALLALNAWAISGFCQKQLPYQDVSLSFEERTEDLLGRLTLSEKVGLLSFESKAVERLNIPEYNFWNECLHGVARSGKATVFPQAIGMAAMWDKDQMAIIADAISDEARAKSQDYVSKGKRGYYQGLTFWTPNINIFRDPRWGRGMETYGEDPYLTARLAVPFIQHLQGNDPKYYKVIATAKHFAVHSGPESTRHSFNVTPSEYDMAETYTPHFEATVKEAKVYSVMCAYQRLNGMPCCGNKYLDNMLRNDWHFNGYIVSDCWAVQDFYEKNAHNIVSTREEAAALAVKSGTDLNCGSSYPALVKATEQGLISEQEIDVSVRRILLARMKLGQFDPDSLVAYTRIPYSVVDSKEHQQLALESARKSIVLLKNDNNTLPFSKNVKKVAVIGPNSDDLDVLLGNYNGFPANPKTPLKGLIEKLPNAEVVFAQGCELAAKLPYLQPIPSEYLYTDASKSTHGLVAEYYSNDTLSGKPSHTRIDSNVDFVWGATSPFADLNIDEFSVRWTGVLVPPVSGEYALAGEAFTGFNLYVDDSLLAHYTNVHSPHKIYERLNLEGGRTYKIRMEYFQSNTSHSLARFLWDAPKPNLKEEALALAKSSDVVVLCMGLSPMLEGEEMKVKVEGFSGGDRLDIKLPATQTQLIREIQELGKPTVLVLLNGSALAFNWEKENIPAIIEAWYPGQAGGTAIADVIFGDYNPAGRLPVTFYKDINQIPAIDNYDMKGKTYRYFEGDPLYEFGYGLSFTTFKYDIVSAPKTVNAGDSLVVKVKITNTGKVDGDEVAQLYVSHPDSKLRKPIRSLQGFNRVNLKAGQSTVVDFVVKPNQMALRDADNNAVVEPGKMVLSVGGKQPDAKSIKEKKVIERQIAISGKPYFIAK